MRLPCIATGLTLLGAVAINGLGGPTPAAAKGLCPLIVAPVCALNRDGTRSNYSNACLARLAHARVLHAGNCLGDVCIFLWKPVCARDPFWVPHTYPNLCVAEQANAVFLHDGECK